MKKIHFVGIKGVGMTALAVMVKQAGLEVTGSDVGEQFITDITLEQTGIFPLVGFSSEHVNDADLVITTGAHGGFDNVEVCSAKEKGIRVVSLAEATGMVMNGELLDRKLLGISVAGTHGKTTTSALVATVLRENKLDPSYFIGTSYIPSLGISGHFGTGNYFVVEADEYATEPVHDKRPKFYWQHPKIALFTNIELDHLDIYSTVDSVRKVFLDFANSLPHDGVLIANGDDLEIRKLLKEYSGRSITFGFSPQNDFVIQRTSITHGNTTFSASAYGTDLGEFELKVNGEHNCLNALGAVIVGLEVGLNIEGIKHSLLSFVGTVRRLEYKGTLSTGAFLYDDYGHHPTEIKKTLLGLRQMYKDKQIICIFQPHTYSRTKALFEQFLTCFSDVDTVIITDIYASKREEADPTISSLLLVNEMKRYHKNAKFLPKLQDVVQYLNEKKYSGDTVIITMGAGDVYKIGDELIANGE